MLFDLRGRGRRRVVKVIYLSLALLMGGGLVFFGIGGDVQGGLFDAFSQGGGNATEQIEKRVENAEKTTEREPQNPRGWAVLAEAQYQLAGQSEGYNPNDGSFSGEARTHLEASKSAWERHLSLAGEQPNTNLAGTMRNALSALGDYPGAVRAQEIVIDSLPDAGYGDYAQLAVLAYQAGQTRKGDLSSERAVKLAPKDQKDSVKQAIDAQKAQAATAGGDAAGGSATPPPASTTGG